MKVAGIVVEYNPFHTGHGYQIAQTRQALGGDVAVVAVMSGNWVQQADCAIADKWVRARLALAGGADLVLELPTLWATASAQGFARGAIALLAATGVVDVLSFGSECGDVAALTQLAHTLEEADYQERLAAFLGEGMSFARARERAVEGLVGQAAALLAKPNNNLGVEYISALHRISSTIQPMTVLRRGAEHNSVGAGCNVEEGAMATAMDPPSFVSATQLRMDLLGGHWDRVAPYMAPEAMELLRAATPSLPSLDRIERAILTRMRTMTLEQWAELPDSGAAEGLPQRLVRAGRQCGSMEEFFAQVKTKRYTHARLRRLVLWAWLGVREVEIPDNPPYLRVLGFGERGQGLLRQMKEQAQLPILTKPAHARALGAQGQRIFALESRFTDLYDLCFETISTPGREWTTGPVMDVERTHRGAVATGGMDESGQH